MEETAPLGSLDMPFPDSTLSGRPLLLTGWALSRHTPVRSVTALIDGQAAATTQPGVHRPDVAREYPDVPGSATSGFHLEAPLAGVPDGWHEVAIRIEDQSGAKTELGHRSVYLSHEVYGEVSEQMSEKLPYQAGLEEAGRQGRVLGRDDIYSSGPPVDAVHEELLKFITQVSRQCIPVDAGHEELLEFIAQVSRQRILDIGCGLGPYVAELNSRGFNCIGIEIEAGLARAAVALGRPVLLMDGQALGFDDKTFDTCLLVEVIEHVHEFEVLLREAGRVARRNIIISVPNINVIPSLSRYNVVPWHILEATHVNFFTPEILQRVLERIFAGQAKVQVDEYAPFFPWAEGEQFYYQIRAVIEMKGYRPYGVHKGFDLFRQRNRKGTAGSADPAQG